MSLPISPSLSLSESLDFNQERDLTFVYKKFKIWFVHNYFHFCLPRSMLNTTEDMVHEQLKMLQGRNLIREQEPGKWVRKVLDEKTGKF